MYTQTESSGMITKQASYYIPLDGVFDHMSCFYHSDWGFGTLHSGVTHRDTHPTVVMAWGNILNTCAWQWGLGMGNILLWSSALLIDDEEGIW